MEFIFDVVVADFEDGAPAEELLAEGAELFELEELLPEYEPGILLEELPETDDLELLEPVKPPLLLDEEPMLLDEKPELLDEEEPVKPPELFEKEREPELKELERPPEKPLASTKVTCEKSNAKAMKNTNILRLTLIPP